MPILWYENQKPLRRMIMEDKVNFVKQYIDALL